MRENNGRTVFAPMRKRVLEQNQNFWLKFLTSILIVCLSKAQRSGLEMKKEVVSLH